jgi:hypothetical protein
MAVFFSIVLPGNLYIIVSSMLAATGGVVILKKIRQVARNERV